MPRARRAEGTSSAVELYDATLRDGMQGQGMALSADEKVRVAQRLDALGVHLVEAGFPGSNPKELELFELLAAEALEQAEIAAFGMTRRRDLAADEDPALRTLAACFAPVCTLVGKTWGLHLEKVVRVGRDENLALIADSVAFLRAARASASSTTPSTSSTASATTRATRSSACAPPPGAGAETVVLCDTNGSSLPSQVGAATARVVAALGAGHAGVRVGIHPHDDAGLRRGQRLRRRRGRARARCRGR